MFQDYFNFAHNPRNLYLPPLQPQFAYNTVPQFSKSQKIAPRSTTIDILGKNAEIPIPKTFTTRKGALLLFSEDMAQKHKDGTLKRRSHRHHRSVDEKILLGSQIDETGDLRTVDDLAKSILLYGSQVIIEIYSFMRKSGIY